MRRQDRMLGDSTRRSARRSTGSSPTSFVQLALQANAFIVLVWLLTAYWAFRDMQHRTMNPVAPYLAAGIIIAFTPFLFCSRSSCTASSGRARPSRRPTSAPLPRRPSCRDRGTPPLRQLLPRGGGGVPSARRRTASVGSVPTAAAWSS
ncbi:MAG: hypothetical protein R3C32_11450 [Chloroflexota bacterium]